MQIAMIGCHYQTGRNKEPNGFRLLDIGSGQLKDVDYASLYNVIANGVEIINIGIEGNKLKGTNGTLERYPKFVGGKFKSNSVIIILRQIGDIGYEVCDKDGTIKKFTVSDTIKCAESMGIANGKLVTKSDGTKFISAIYGEYPCMPQEQVEVLKRSQQNQKPVDTKAKTKSSNNKTQVQDIDKEKENDKNDTAKTIDESKKSVYSDKVKKSKMPSIRGNEVPTSKSKLKSIIESEDMTVEQKLARGLLVIKEMRPFYYAVLQTIPKKESVEIPTMAVSFDSFYFNSEFVKNLALSDIVFVELHEVCHIAMRHLFRRGARDPKMWNVATDLYINKLLCDEFNLEPGKPPVVLDRFRVGVSAPSNMLYDFRIDISKDTPESIYTELEKESIEKKSSLNITTKSDSNNQENSGDQPGQGSQDGKDNQNGNKSGQSGSANIPGNQTSEESGKSGNQPGQNGNQGNQNGGQGSQNRDQPGQNGNQPGQGDDQDDSSSENQIGEVVSKDYIFRGKKIHSSMDIYIYSDMIEDASSKGMSETAKNSKYDSIMKKAKVLERQMSQGKGKGHYGVVETFVDEELVPKINWRTILMNRLVALRSDEKSLSTPDRRFAHNRLYIEGEREEDELLKDIKVCVDTSGSMSDQDLAIAFAQINQLLKTYKTDAELIFWDDGIQSINKFDDKATFELAKHKATGRGGTDPNCLFELFTSRDYKIGKRAKPELIIIFTDGYFSGPSEKYKSKFGRDTLWVISGDNLDGSSRFEPPFGKVAKLKGRN